MAITTARSRDEFIALIDNALETAIATCLDTTLPYVDVQTGLFTPGIRKVTRAQVCRKMAQRALRKSVQGGMRIEMLKNPPVTAGQ